MQWLNIWETCQSDIIGIIYYRFIHWDNYSNYLIYTVNEIILELLYVYINIKY